MRWTILRAETSLKHRSKDKILKKYPNQASTVFRAVMIPDTDHMREKATSLSVGLGYTLQLILLLDGIAVGTALGCVDQLVTETLSDGLDVPEGSLPGASAEKPDGLVDPPQRRNINSLPSDCACATAPCAVLPGTRVDDRIDHHLDTDDVKYWDLILQDLVRSA